MNFYWLLEGISKILFFVLEMDNQTETFPTWALIWLLLFTINIKDGNKFVRRFVTAIFISFFLIRRFIRSWQKYDQRWICWPSLQFCCEPLSAPSSSFLVSELSHNLRLWYSPFISVSCFFLRLNLFLLLICLSLAADVEFKLFLTIYFLTFQLFFDHNYSSSSS